VIIGEYFINLRALPKLEQFSIFKVVYAKTNNSAN